MTKINLFWFRRDLRLHDNRAFFHALKNGNVLPVFIFDKNILEKLESKNDKRVNFIYNEVKNLKSEIEKYGSSLYVVYDSPLNAFRNITNTYPVEALFINHDYEPYALERDRSVINAFKSLNIPVYSYKDQVIFEKEEIIKSDGKPYTVFTPYMKKWKEQFNKQELKFYYSEKILSNLHKTTPFKFLPLNDLGFQQTGLNIPSKEINLEKIKYYDKFRNFPSINGTSRLSIHLRFGTISIRQLIKATMGLNDSFLSELIWREFYMMILYFFPDVIKNSFKPAYDRIEWINNEKHFELWCNGQTGYPIVDAGMRELNETGFMHNRARMITASFLTKHLLIDWRWGEAYFGQKLLDYELSSNNGGWQWAASTGCDSVPYFRIFNPKLQTNRFDPKLEYIRKWISEYNTQKYPKPVVEHNFARIRAIDAYKQAIQKNKI